MRRAELFLFFCIFAIIANCSYADTYTVTNLSYADPGSLSWAIEMANKNPGPDLIDFSVSGTIKVESKRLPPIIDDRTTIDASSIWKGNFPDGEPGVTILCPNGKVAEGLVIKEHYCKIRGLAVIGFTKVGIDLAGSHNTVGGVGRGYRNVVSGNLAHGSCGVFMHGKKSSHNVVAGNYIGVTPDGQKPLGNFDGILIWEACWNTIGGTAQRERNIISGNVSNGIMMVGPKAPAMGNKILGNYIGLDPSGTMAIKNDGDGIFIAEGAFSNIIGGTGESMANVISGNHMSGITTVDKKPQDYNEIVRNYIGTAANGYDPLGNRLDGIHCWIASPVIHKNVIAYNSVGVGLGKESSPDLGGGGRIKKGFNSIYKNIDLDIFNGSSKIVMAEHNWWGGYPPDPKRFGGPVDVDYIPALKKPWSGISVHPAPPIGKVLDPIGKSASAWGEVKRGY
jgi:hypothetical protein